MIVAVLAVTALAVFGKIPPDKAMAFVTITFPTWVLGQSLEDKEVKAAFVRAKGADAKKDGDQ